VTSQHADDAGLRLLVVGASSDIGHAVAVSAAERGAKVAVAARRMEMLSQLADTIGGSAFELDVEDSAAISEVVDAGWGHEFGKEGIEAYLKTKSVWAQR
jgi:NADP-dependent 3-hydroxy acid dehydrogenase YdfG